MNALYSSLFEPISGPLLTWSVLRCEGPDAEAFLQSQLSSDVATLHSGSAQWSAWLNAKGRVVALFLLLRRDAQTFELLLPDHAADTLATELSRFILRRKARLSPRPTAQVTGGIAQPAPESALRLGGPIPRWLLLDDSGRAIEALPIDRVWKQLDLLSGVPRLGAAGGSHTAHMLGLDRLQAISLSKGCYPGQEIVARTHYLGQSKRGIACLRADGDTLPVRGSALQQQGQTLGEVLESVPTDAGGCLVQAVASALQVGALYECGTTQAEALALIEAPTPLA